MKPTVGTRGLLSADRQIIEGRSTSSDLDDAAGSVLTETPRSHQPPTPRKYVHRNFAQMTQPAPVAVSGAVPLTLAQRGDRRRSRARGPPAPAVAVVAVRTPPRPGARPSRAVEELEAISGVERGRGRERGHQPEGVFAGVPAGLALHFATIIVVWSRPSGRQGTWVDDRFRGWIGDRSEIEPRLCGLTALGRTRTARPYGSPRPSSKNGAGAKSSSRSGRSRSGGGDEPVASATLDVSMPRRARAQQAPSAAQCSSSSVVACRGVRSCRGIFSAALGRSCSDCRTVDVGRGMDRSSDPRRPDGCRNGLGALGASGADTDSS